MMDWFKQLLIDAMPYCLALCLIVLIMILREVEKAARYLRDISLQVHLSRSQSPHDWIDVNKR